MWQGVTGFGILNDHRCLAVCYLLVRGHACALAHSGPWHLLSGTSAHGLWSTNSFSHLINAWLLSRRVPTAETQMISQFHFRLPSFQTRAVATSLMCQNMEIGRTSLGPIPETAAMVGSKVHHVRGSSRLVVSEQRHHILHPVEQIMRKCTQFGQNP